ncbi:MAG: hypothetical protein IPJ55_17530 [Chloracidobacterium sp.]|nr:hypothetical protein [Chloracidobacterium sp.]
MMVPRRVFDEIDGFDLRLSTSADWDLQYRVSRRYTVSFVPELLLKYRVHNSNMHANVGVMEHDMMLAFEKAFRTNDAGDPGCKTDGLWSLHQILAGSYFVAGIIRHSFSTRSRACILSRETSVISLNSAAVRRIGEA